jgi:2-(1,2-epoxy-1,2-dihydrophenyl)acetyl-CoA isomerase
MVPAAEAHAMGMVARVVPAAELEDVIGSLAAELAAGAPLAQRFIKSGLGRASAMSFEQTLAWEEQAQAVLLGSDDVREGAAAFLEKRPPQFRGE